jgi:hypothetical protein
MNNGIYPPCESCKSTSYTLLSKSNNVEVVRCDNCSQEYKACDTTPLLCAEEVEEKESSTYSVATSVTIIVIAFLAIIIADLIKLTN